MHISTKQAIVTALALTLGAMAFASTSVAENRQLPASGKATKEKLPANLPLGENHPAFLQGIFGQGQLWANIQTDMGTIQCQLYEDKTPQTIMNFVGLARGMKAFQDPQTKKPVRRPFYNGVPFHRVIPNFMIQVGDPTGQGTYTPGYRFEDEFIPTLRFDRAGVLAMANAGPKTNGSQFFITDAPTPHLNDKHTIFGQCGNLDIVKTIANAPTGPRNKPVRTVTIKAIAFERR